MLQDILKNTKRCKTMKIILDEPITLQILLRQNDLQITDIEKSDKLWYGNTKTKIPKANKSFMILISQMFRLYQILKYY